MADFRSRRSFGVAGVLSEKCHVFYHTLFHTKQLGRITDLLVSRFKQARTDEFGVRMAMTLGCFQGVHGDQEVFSEPLFMEVGIDSAWIAVGLSFDTQGFDLTGIETRLKQGAPQGRVENILWSLLHCSDQMIVRYQENSKRLEIISMQKIGQAVLENTFGPGTLHVFALEKNLEAEVKAGAYVELGDLDYAKLLQDEVELLGKKVPAGEFLAQVAENPTRRDEMIHRIEGASLATSLESIVIDGGPSQSLNQETLTISATESDDAGPSPKESSPSVFGRLRSIVGKMFETASQSIDGPSEGSPEEKHGIGISTTEALEEAPADYPLDSPSAHASTDAPAEPIASDELQEGFESIEMNVKKVRSEIESPRAQKILDGMMGDLTVQKSKLRELTRNLNLVMSQRELAIKSERQAMQETLRRNELILRQRESALAKAKEQIGTLSNNMDRLKATASSAQNEAQLKRKFDHAVDKAQSLALENEALKKKVESLRVAGAGQKEKTGAQSELLAIKEKYARSIRQVEELKKQNANMMEKISSDRVRNTVTATDATKGKMDQVMRIANEKMREADVYKAQVLKMEQEELKLKRKIQELRTQIKQMGPKSGSGDPGKDNAA